MNILKPIIMTTAMLVATSANVAMADDEVIVFDKNNNEISFVPII